MLIVLVALAITWFPQIQNSSLIAAGGILATAIELIGFVNDRKSKEESQQGIIANPTHQTINTGTVRGDLLSGRFDGPTATGGKALDMRGATGPIIEPIGPVSQYIGDIIIKPQEKLPVPRIQAPPQDFVGRDDELKEMLNNFERGATITGLRGMGGVGKTALALVLADKLKSRFQNGQIFLRLEGTSPNPLKPADAMVQVIRAFSRLRRTLAGRPKRVARTL